MSANALLKFDSRDFSSCESSFLGFASVFSRHSRRKKTQSKNSAPSTFWSWVKDVIRQSNSTSPFRRRVVICNHRLLLLASDSTHRARQFWRSCCSGNKPKKCYGKLLLMENLLPLAFSTRQ
ncbi:hypothetical protein ISCGN_024223 [Ixodes scapularis]